MPLSTAAKTLWTPGGNISLREKGVVPITQSDIAVLARLHEFASKHGLSLVCQRCDTAVVGHNADTDDKLAVACQCREFRFYRTP